MGGKSSYRYSKGPAIEMAKYRRYPNNKDQKKRSDAAPVASDAVKSSRVVKTGK